MPSQDPWLHKTSSKGSKSQGSAPIFFRNPTFFSSSSVFNPVLEQMEAEVEETAWCTVLDDTVTISTKTWMYQKCVLFRSLLNLLLHKFIGRKENIAFWLTPQKKSDLFRNQLKQHKIRKCGDRERQKDTEETRGRGRFPGNYRSLILTMTTLKTRTFSMRRKKSISLLSSHYWKSMTLLSLKFNQLRGMHPARTLLVK